MKQVSGTQSIHYRNYRRARDRALTRLSKLYPKLYRELLAEERELDEQEGTIWSLAGDGKLSVTTHTRANAVPVFNTDTRDARKDESDNGGEA